jgi:hypothetical protein
MCLVSVMMDAAYRKALADFIVASGSFRSRRFRLIQVKKRSTSGGCLEVSGQQGLTMASVALGTTPIITLCFFLEPQLSITSKYRLAMVITTQTKRPTRQPGRTGANGG